MTFYLLRAYHRRTNAVNVPNNEIQMGAARGRRSAVAAQVISWQFMAPLRETEPAGRLHSKVRSRTYI